MKVDTQHKARMAEYKGAAVEHPVAYLPVFPGTNCDYDTARAFRRAGARGYDKRLPQPHGR